LHYDDDYAMEFSVNSPSDEPGYVSSFSVTAGSNHLRRLAAITDAKAVTDELERQASDPRAAALIEKPSL
jgi:hypothetical protein